jgi:hypothetical protein
MTQRAPRIIEVTDASDHEGSEPEGLQMPGNVERRGAGASKRAAVPGSTIPETLDE